MRILDAEDVGKLIGIKGTTVLRYLHWSEPGGRYSHHPFPPESGILARTTYYWTEDKIEDIIAWHQGRVGSGTRTDLKKKKAGNDTEEVPARSQAEGPGVLADLASGGGRSGVRAARRKHGPGQARS